MIIKRVTGMLQSNCYIAGNDGEGMVIDPGADIDDILDAVKETELDIRYIVMTHAHLDHIASLDRLRDATGAQVLIHELESGYLADPCFNGSQLFGVDKSFKEADRTLQHDDTVECGGIVFRIIHTPGHTPGGICILAEGCLFSGDTLFRMSVGRTDLGNGDWSALMDSIRNRLMKLDDKTVVYPGHGAGTTIGYEKENNPHFV